MRCKVCDYRLWNLETRRCPECGTPFSPSEFEFVPNSVQFCCPECGQAYFGNGPHGHLVPAEFDCVSCGRRIHMDDMILRPADGVDEERTRPTSVPWAARGRRGWLYPWLATIRMAIVHPCRLMESLPHRAPLSRAWSFALLTNALVMAAVVTPFIILPVLVASRFGGGAPACGGWVCGLLGVSTVALVAWLAFVGIWGLWAHGILALTGSTEAGPGRTYQGILYGSAANIATALPCLGQYVGWIWWAVNSTLMVKAGQRVGGGRAALAVLSWPIVTVVGGAVLYAMLIIGPALTAAPVPATTTAGVPSATGDTRLLVQALRQYAKLHGGHGPAHAAELLRTSAVTPLAFTTMETATDIDRVPVGETTLGDLLVASPAEVARAARTAAGELPEAVIAHRLGDFVFTYHGIDPRSANPGLWLVIWSPDPAQNPAAATSRAGVVVGCAGGRALQLPGGLKEAVAKQNRLRARYGLPPLPDPATVTHERPAAQAP